MTGVIEFGFIAALLGKLLAGIGSALGLWKAASSYLNLKRPIKVLRISDPNNEDFQEMFHLHENLFKSHVADDASDLQNWITESSAKNKSDKKFDDILLCAKSQDKVVGYLFCQYYYNSKFIFISYLAIDSDSIEARRFAVSELILHLLKLLKRAKCEWTCAIAEVEEYKRVNYGNTADFEPHAKKLMLTFQIALQKICKKRNIDAKLYRILFGYMQPALRTEEINDYNKHDPRDFEQRIIYIPKDSFGVETKGALKFIPRSTMEDIIRFIVKDVYGDAYPDDSAYQDYLDALTLQMLSKCDERTEISTDWRRAIVTPCGSVSA